MTDFRNPLVVILSTLTFVAAADPLPSQEAAPSQCALAVSALSYPAAALSARIMGAVSATLQFDNRGAPDVVEVQGYPILASEVISAIHSAPMAAATTCAGRKVIMRFNFILDQNLEPKTPVSVKSTLPFDYAIVSPVEPITVTNSDPAWIFTRRGLFFHHAKLVFAKLKFW